VRLRRRAREAGFGAVRAVYRERRDAAGAFFVPLLVGVVVGLPAALAARSWWLGLLLSVLILVPPGSWYVFGPVAGPSGRRWYAVCEGGVVAWSRRGGYVAVSWEELAAQRERRRAGGGPVWAYPEAGAWDLYKALDASRPVRFALPRQLAVTAVVGTWLGTAFAVVAWPWCADLLRGEQPPQAMRDLDRVCTTGEGHARAAPYEGGTPHPAALFEEGFFSLATAGPGRPEPAPPDVQVVACVRPAERSSHEPDAVCPYTDGRSVSYFPATYRVEVYEARTGRPLGDFTLEATDKAPGCAVSEVFPEDERHLEENLTPTDKQYETNLVEFVTGGPAR
jgi:hypothetical protein